MTRTARPPRARIRLPWESALFILALLGLWQGLTAWVRLPNPALFPSPALTFRALLASLPELLKGTRASFLILVPGYAAAVVLGVVWGLLVGTTGWLQRTFFPFARAAAPVPPTVYIPYAIALLPSFRLSAIFVVFLGAFWPIFLNAAAGAAGMPARHRDNARLLGMGRTAYLRRVVFRAALPHIFTGMGVGLGLAFILLTVAELFGASAGLGRFVQYYADFADYPRMVAGILFTGLVTLLAMGLLERVRRRALFWNR